MIASRCFVACSTFKGPAHPSPRRVLVTLTTFATTLVAALAFASAPALAKLTHKFEGQISEYQAGTPIGHVESMTVDGGNLLTADNNRVDEFNASSDAFVAQLPPIAVGAFQSLAVGHSTGQAELYGTSVGSNVVAALGVGACGTVECASLQNQWTGADTPNESFVTEKGEGQGRITGVAVDGSASAADWAKGDVFVSTRGEFTNQNFNLHVVDVFRPLAGGGEEYVTQLKGTPLEGELATGQGEPFEGPLSVAVSDATGDVIVKDEDRVVDVFEPTGLDEYAFVDRLTGPSASVPFDEVGSVAVAGASGPGAGDIFVAGRVGSVEAVYEFSPTGEFLDRITGPTGEKFSRPLSVAVDSVSGRVFVADYGGFRTPVKPSFVDVFSGALVVPDVLMEGPVNFRYEPVAHTLGLELTGSVNPDGAGPATCDFAWGSTPAPGNIAPCEGAGENAGDPVPDGSSFVPVHTSLSGLPPGTTYYYRVETSNASGENEGEESQDAQFTTPGPVIGTESVADIASSSATLEASINPLGSSTSYYFEYDTRGYSPGESPHGVATMQSGVGAGESPVPASIHVQHLLEHTAYHYRVVIVSEVEIASGETQRLVFYGSDETFTTQRPSNGSQLPDGREWELVSPPNKHGGAIVGLVKSFSPTQAAADGDAMTYTTFVATESDPAGSSTATQVLSERGVDGWSSKDITAPHAAATGVEPTPEFQFFSQDLTSALVALEGKDGTLLSGRASEPTPYVRNQARCAGGGEECYLPLVSGKEGFSDVQPGAQFGGRVEFEGASPDLKHVVLKTSVQLTETSTTGKNVYEWSSGVSAAKALQLVSVLPASEGGGPANAGSVGLPPANLRWGVIRHAVSEDGSRIVWTGDGHLYVRDLVKEETVKLGSGEAVFQAASSDGSRVFFTNSTGLEAAAGGDLYECHLIEEAGKLRCALTDLTPQGGGHSGEVLHMLSGVSEDGRYVYFVANTVLAAGATPGNCREGPPEAPGNTCNLYVYHGGETEYIATLSMEDEGDWGGSAGVLWSLGNLTAEASPDGRYLAFTSTRSLTGYDNRDARSGRPDEEVYEYDALAHKLVCASCDPTGARPTGLEEGTFNGVDGEESLDLADVIHGPGNNFASSSWVAADLPSGVPLFPFRESLYQPRYLSDGGRLFFNSSDALVAQDVNGQEDVYEFEPAGVGSCSAASATYADASGGCVGLISSGTSGEESGFMDASESGEDVFFLTSERLVGEDYDTALDVYDAHVCSAGVPCVSAPTPGPPCGTADACRAAPSPQPPIFGAPASATFSGAGNVPAVGAAPVVRGKALTRVQKLDGALRACRKRYARSRRRRVACERQAQERYRSGKAGKAAKTTRRVGR